MGVREKFEKKIREKQEEIDELERKLNEARVYIQAMQDSIKLLPKDENGAAEKPTFRHGSITQKTYEILKNAGKPLHFKEILAALGMEVNRQSLSTLRGSIGAYIRDEKIFFSSSPGMVGLIGYKYQSEGSKETEEAQEEK